MCVLYYLTCVVMQTYKRGTLQEHWYADSDSDENDHQHKKKRVATRTSPRTKAKQPPMEEETQAANPGFVSDLMYQLLATYVLYFSF